MGSDSPGSSRSAADGPGRATPGSRSPAADPNGRWPNRMPRLDDRKRSMSDQADGLRQLVRRAVGPGGPAAEPPAAEGPVAGVHQRQGGRRDVEPGPEPGDRAGRAGQRVVLVDADLGLANIDLLCGLAPRLRPGRRAGRAPAAGRRDRRRARRHPDRPRGARRSRTLAEVLGDGPARLVEELAELEARPTSCWSTPARASGPSIATLAAAADAGGGRHDARADLGGRRPRRDPAGSAAWRRRRRCGRWSTRPARRPRPTEVLARLAASSRQFLGHGGHAARPRPRPTRTCRWRSGPVGRSWSLIPQLARLARRPAAGPGPDRGATGPGPRRPGFFASLAARWALRAPGEPTIEATGRAKVGSDRCDDGR